MQPQNFQAKTDQLRQRFLETLRADPSLKDKQLKLSWSNWGFGIEGLAASAERLRSAGIEWIELHGNRYGEDLGYRAADVKAVLDPRGISVAGVCGMFGPENDMASPSGIVRQNAIDYIRRQLDLCQALGGSYMLVVPAAVGRPDAYDEQELHRSIEALRVVADDFAAASVQAAIEPIRAAEVSIVHSVRDALDYIAAVDHPAIQHVNGDVYHMQVEESHIGEAIVTAGERLVNLHLADSNRCALGAGSLDLDAVLMALYVVGYVDGRRFATPEPLGPGGDPYPRMYGRPAPTMLDALVRDSARYFRIREAEIKTLVD